MCKESKNMCIWTQDSENSDVWLSSCGKAFWVAKETVPNENKVKYCVFCGHQVKKVVFQNLG